MHPPTVTAILLAAGATGLRAGLLALLVLGLGASGVAAWRAVGRRGGPGRGDDVGEPSGHMPLLGHVAELRRRILWSAATVLLGAAVAFSFRVERVAWGVGWTLRPAVADNLAAQVFSAMADHLVPAGVQLVVTRPVDAVVAELAVALALGVALAVPVLSWQVGRFLAPALRPRERRVLAQLLLPVVGLFAAGAAFAWWVVLPFLLDTLYGYADPLGATPLLRISDLVSFAVGMVLVFGVAFQTPVVMYGLARVGLVSAGAFARGWRVALVAILVLSALVTDPTVVSQVMVAAPLFGLYLVGIGLAGWGAAGLRRASG